MIRNNVIWAGNGSPGQNGSKGENGTDGSPGDAGLNSKEVGSATCLSSDHSPGGSGGGGNCGEVMTSGGNGGERICPDYVGSSIVEPIYSENGTDGLNSGAGLGGCRLGRLPESR